MAQITWMNVPIPDIGGAEQQGIRTAADLFKQATTSATGMVDQFQGMQDADRAAQVAAADRFALENMLSTQDPRQYQQMVDDGSLLGPAASRVSNATLLAAEQRGNQLYTLDRERTADREMSAAIPFFDAAAREATNNPDRAQEILSRAPITDVRRAGPLTEEIRKLYVPPDSAGRAAKRKEEIDRKSADLADRMFAKGNDPEGVNSVLLEEADPLVRQNALTIVATRGGDTRQFYGFSPTPTEGGTPRVVDGPQNALSRQFGPNEKFVAQAAREGNYFPGSPEWMYQNGNRSPTMGDVHDFQERVVKPQSARERGEGRATTAVGPAQIVNKTRRDIISRYGQKLFGTTDMSKIPYTLENEEKIAGVIYDEQVVKNKDPLAWQATQQYNSLKDLKAFDGKSWDEAKPLLYYIDGGVAPPSHREKVKQFESILQKRSRGLSEGALAILNAEPNSTWGLAQASEQLAKSLGKDALPGDVREIIESTVRKAKEAGSTINYAEAVELIKNSISDDGWTSFSDLTESLALEESKLSRTTKDLGNARADYEAYKSSIASLTKLQELSKKYDEDQGVAKSQLSKAKEKNASNGVATINAFKRWQSTSDRLGDELSKVVAGTGSKAVKRSLADEVRPEPGQFLAPAAQTPDIDLMSEPKKAPRSKSKLLDR